MHCNNVLTENNNVFVRSHFEIEIEIEMKEEKRDKEMTTKSGLEVLYR